MVRLRVSLTRRKYALEHHSGVRRRRFQRSTITLGAIERLAASTTAENLGVNLRESKQIANRLQDTVVKQQLQGHCEQSRKCPTCGKQRPVNDFPLQTAGYRYIHDDKIRAAHSRNSIEAKRGMN